MKHPFDDFISPSWHKQRLDNRVARIGILLVAVVLTTTAAAFATTLSGWKGIRINRDNVATKWEDASERVHAFVKTQKEIQDAIDELRTVGKYIDGVPRSLLLWQLTQTLPEEMRLDDVRLETRKRVSEKEGVSITETIMLLGVAPNDSSISAYIDQLSSAPFFSNVSLLYAQLDSSGLNRNFSIQMTVVPTVQLAAENIQ
jgi:Tfp pilus assembly protein PilN